MVWLVTGAQGFLGLALVAAIGRACPGARIVACDIAAPGAAEAEAEALAPLGDTLHHQRLDVTDPAAVAAVIAHHRPARVIHAAGLTPSLAPDPVEAARVMAVNLGGSLAMIRACLATPPARLLLVSSAGVYAPAGPAALLEEDAPVMPAGPYAALKLALEQAARVWGAELDIITVRPGPLYGPTERMRPSRPRLSLIGRMAEALARGAPFSLAAPDAGRDWTHAGDAADAIVALAFNPAPSARLFNITSGRRHTNADLARAFAARGLRIDWQDRPPERHEADGPTFSARLLQAETGLRLRHGLDDGIATLVRPTP